MTGLGELRIFYPKYVVLYKILRYEYIMKTKGWKGFTNISNEGKHAQAPAWEDTPVAMDGCLLKWNRTCIMIYKRPCVCGQF